MFCFGAAVMENKKFSMLTCCDYQKTLFPMLMFLFAAMNVRAHSSHVCFCTFYETIDVAFLGVITFD
jgi:hypothetical protein